MLVSHTTPLKPCALRQPVCGHPRVHPRVHPCVHRRQMDTRRRLAYSVTDTIDPRLSFMKYWCALHPRTHAQLASGTCTGPQRRHTARAMIVALCCGCTVHVSMSSCLRHGLS